MISPFLLLVSFITKSNAFKYIFNKMQIFYLLYSMLYTTVNLGLHNCVGFL